VFGRIKKNGLKRPFPTFEIFRARTSGTDSDLNQQSLKNFQFRISNREWRADWLAAEAWRQMCELDLQI
jgi:hypothetical protein